MDNVLKQAWYAAAWAADVSQDLFARTILGEPILLYRKADGTPVAVADRCPHRFAPLHMGRRVGDAVECGYHGMRFDATGRCIHSPAGDSHVAGKALLRTYPVIERNGLVWIWPGRPADADPESLPDFGDLLANPGYRYKIASPENYIHVAANYLLIIDNLVDLSHISVVHANSLAQRFPLINQSIIEVTAKHRSVAITLDITGSPSAMGDGGLVDQWVDTAWHAPSTVSFTTWEVAAGEPRRGPDNDVALHFVTPETDLSAHYFYIILMGDRTASAMNEADTRTLVRHVFETEDKPVFEACQQRMGTSDLQSLRPVFLSGDKAGATVRRTLENLIAEEVSERPAAIAPAA